MSALREYLRKQLRLPRRFRDFHDQKDFFKSLHEWMDSEEKVKSDSVYKMPDWATGHIYAIDFFLRFMALHGWTLQRSRARGVEFCDIDATVKERREREDAAFREFVKHRQGTP